MKISKREGLQSCNRNERGDTNVYLLSVVCWDWILCRKVRSTIKKGISSFGRNCFRMDARKWSLLGADHIGRASMRFHRL